MFLPLYSCYCVQVNLLEENKTSCPSASLIFWKSCDENDWGKELYLQNHFHLQFVCVYACSPKRLRKGLLYLFTVFQLSLLLKILHSGPKTFSRVSSNFYILLFSTSGYPAIACIPYQHGCR